MTTSRDDLIDAMQELIDAHAWGREVMETADALLRFGITQLRNGTDFIETMAKAPTAIERQAAQDAFRSITEARHKLRLLLLDVCLQQGMSVREVGEKSGHIPPTSGSVRGGTQGTPDRMPGSACRGAGRTRVDTSVPLGVSRHQLLLTAVAFWWTAAQTSSGRRSPSGGPAPSGSGAGCTGFHLPLL